jgi:hypothetical protein
VRALFGRAPGSSNMISSVIYDENCRSEERLLLGGRSADSELSHASAEGVRVES